MADDYERAFRQYEAEYRLTTPPPVRADHGVGFPAQFWLFLPVALLGPVVSGLRTAAVFGRNAGTAGMGDQARWVVAVLGTLVVELGVVGFQIERLRRLAEGKKKLPAASIRWVWVGLICAFGTALIANLDIVFLDALAKAGVEVPAWIEPLLVGLFLGAGVPVLALVAGEIVGRMIVEVQVQRQVAEAKSKAHYEKEMAAWRKGLKASWDRVKRRHLAGDRTMTVDSIQPAGTGRSTVMSSRTKPKASEAMAGHLSAIRQTLADRRQLGEGDGTFTRADVEHWREVSASQAKNILRWSIQYRLVEVVREDSSGYVYRFLGD